VHRFHVRIHRRPANVPVDAPHEPVYWRTVFTGLRYQCVEFARRYLLQTRGLVFDRVDFAYEILNLPVLKDPFKPDVSPVPWPTHSNLDYTPAACPAGSLIIWSPAGFYEPTGHVAVVVRATPAWVEIVEQNEETTRRRLPIVEGRIRCTRSDTSVIGWKPLQPVAPLPPQASAPLQ
jgi:hypothetical protein